MRNIPGAAGVKGGVGSRQTTAGSYVTAGGVKNQVAGNINSSASATAERGRGNCKVCQDGSTAGRNVSRDVST